MSETGARVARQKLARYTTLGVGGEAEVWSVSTQEQLLEAIQQPYRILGGGSNLLVSDEGISERVIRLTGGLAERDLNLTRDQDAWRTGWIGGGVPLPGLLRALQKQGLSNLEGTVGIPGQVGGSVWMNAGTRYGEMFDALALLEIVTPQGIRHVTPDELDWGYRHSGIARGEVVSRVQLKLQKSTPQAVAAKMEQADQARKGQPKNRTPGCAFKNPVIDGKKVSAGLLIDQAGLKGTRIGGAVIAPEHGNFIVNLGDATAVDVLALLNMIRERVEVPLELEYEIWS